MLHAWTQCRDVFLSGTTKIALQKRWCSFRKCCQFKLVDAPGLPWPLSFRVKEVNERKRKQQRWLKNRRRHLCDMVILGILVLHKQSTVPKLQPMILHLFIKNANLSLPAWYGGGICCAVAFSNFPISAFVEQWCRVNNGFNFMADATWCQIPLRKSKNLNNKNTTSQVNTKQSVTAYRANTSVDFHRSIITDAHSKLCWAAPDEVTTSFLSSTSHDAF